MSNNHLMQPQNCTFDMKPVLFTKDHLYCVITPGRACARRKPARLYACTAYCLYRGSVVLTSSGFGREGGWSPGRQCTHHSLKYARSARRRKMNEPQSTNQLRPARPSSCDSSSYYGAAERVQSIVEQDQQDTRACLWYAA